MSTKRDGLDDALAAMAAAGHAAEGASSDEEAQCLREALEAVTDLLTANYDGVITVGMALWAEFDAAVESHY